MGRLSQLTWKPGWSFAAIAVLAAVMLLGFVGSTGLWEPHEISVLGELDRYRAERDRDAAPGAPGEAEAQRARPAAKGAPDKAERSPCETGEPVLPLGKRFTELSRQTFGDSEWALRMPLALGGVLVVLFTWLLARSFTTTRGAHLAALVILSFPALVIGSRQLTGDSISILAMTLLMLSAVHLFWPREGARPWHTGLAAFALVLALAMSYRASGLLVGVFAPACAMAIAGLCFSIGAWLQWRKSGELPGPRVRVAAATVVASLVALGAMALFLREVFDLVPAGTADRQFAGMTLAPCVGRTAAALGEWRPLGDLEVNFDALVESIAFGAFPWVALAPIALGRLGFVRELDRRALLGTSLFAWAAVTWLVSAVVARKIGPLHYAAYPALAIAIGDWIDRAWSRASSDDGAPGRAPLVALFAALAALVIAKDLGAFPDEIASIGVAGPVYTYPAGSPLKYGVVVLGALFAIAVFCALGVEARDLPARMRRIPVLAFPVAIGLALAVTAYLIFVFHPLMAEKLSSRHSFDVLTELRKPGQPLGVLGRLGAGPEHYAGEDFERLGGRGDLQTFLSRNERVFALMPVGDLCGLHAAASDGSFRYHVLDDRNSKHLLLSNRLEAGETDRNELARTIVREKPADVGTPVSVDFDGKVELIGVRMPRAVERGESFEMTLYFHVKERPRRNWNVFLHFDGPGQRFQGDHDPADTLCAATQWTPGDYIIDTVTVEAGGVTYPKGDYTAWVGLFTGSAGNWSNMKIATKGADAADRFPIGVVRVQ